MFANAVKATIDYLRPVLAARPESASGQVLYGLTVADRVPEAYDSQMPAPLLVIRRSGGAADGMIRDFPRLDFLNWHRSEFEATAMANIIRWVMLYLPAGTMFGAYTVYRVEEFVGPIKMPDPAGSAVDIVMFTLSVPLRISTP